MAEQAVPKVSIITPAYNAGLFIAETIASVQAQTISDWEMLITDDGSTDDTASLVSALAASDPRIRLFRQSNGRQGKARNLGLQHAKAPWIAFLDADDLWHPDKLRRQFEVLDLNPEAGLVFTAGHSFDSDTGQVQEAFPAREGLIGADEMYREILLGYSLPVLSVLVARHWIDRVGGFEKDLRVQNAEDYQLWLKLADAGIRMYGLNEPLFRYRIHGSQTTFQDGINLPSVIWALALAKLSRVKEEDKFRLMERRLNRYLVHQIDVLEGKRLDKVVALYKEPLRHTMRYFQVSLLLGAGKKYFKSWAYRKLSLEAEAPAIHPLLTQ
ncbi:MAG: glycosyltransferase family 2 protein [Bacteroidota bacterium]|jgi:teichuronic acid biosynthesis glycosyltransferase TuaG